ncbi:MAG: efflux RND transporter periplasmic adaptor subunit [Gammaproteobacteria bacterium]|nr:efflux RND transporter periplasmic adaptor subunit [Gammaproteobacteria bacterium]
MVPANRVIVGGSVKAWRSVVLTAQLPGRVVGIAGEEGDSFRQGEVLVKINDDELLAQRQNAEAQYYSAYQELNNANVQLYRQQESRQLTNQTPGGMGMPGMFDEVFSNPMSEFMGIRDTSVERGADLYGGQSRVQQAQYAIDQVLAQIRQIDSKLRDSMSIAPFDGVIVSKNIEVGDTIQPGQPLLVYEDLSILQIVVDVPDRQLPGLVEGQLLTAQVDGINRPTNVRISKIFPTSDPVRHTTQVEFTLPLDTRAAPGNYAEVWIPVGGGGDSERLLVPAAAVIERGGLPSIFVVNQQNLLELRLVRVNEILPSGMAVIRYGVKANERVVVNPPSYLTSGRSIQ